MFVQSLDDRRDTIRVNFITDVSVNLPRQDMTIRGELRDLSMSGMSIQTREQVATGSPCTVTILINGLYSQLVVNKLEGEVMRSEPGIVAIKFRHKFNWQPLFHGYGCHGRKNHGSLVFS
ncbi:hypothetical protein MNBD_DELTA04-1065 [hydrothermal vent metagenome]|uniref:PilZ domain-containing protein n=1 Tax=hydrothermal vent metagenome TaxID=652676 RepID=A0A3B0VR34_9ZZZZ